MRALLLLLSAHTYKQLSSTDCYTQNNPYLISAETVRKSDWGKKKSPSFYSQRDRVKTEQNIQISWAWSSANVTM